MGVGSEQFGAASAAVGAQRKVPAVPAGVDGAGDAAGAAVPFAVFPQVLIADTAGNPARQIRCFIDDHDHGHDEAAG